MRAKKGEYGYFSREHRRRLLQAVLLLILPVAIFLFGYIYTGSRENIATVLAIVGCLPACRAIVSFVMVMMQKSIPEEEYEKIQEHAKDLEIIYELYLTTEKQSGYVDAYAICGNEVVGYSSNSKTDIKFIAQHTQKILRENGYKENVKILRDLKPFLERLDSLQRNRESLESNIPFTPDEKYPELSREQLIRHTILAIAL